MTSLDVCVLMNGMNIKNRPGNLRNISKKEFAELMLKHAPEVDEIPPGEQLVVEFPDGRILNYSHHYWPPNQNRMEEEFHEWSVELTTLDQRTERCLRRSHTRKGWLYIAPYNNPGYKIDPSGKWSYLVWK